MNSAILNFIRISSVVVVIAGSFFPSTVQAVECNDMWSFVAKSCNRITDTARTGQNELFVSGYSWHDPNQYSASRRATINSNAWGLGYAKTKDDTDGDSHSVFVLGFLGSHKSVQWQAGYLWQTYLGKTGGLQAGVGLGTMIIQRPDIFKGIPFPAIVPMASIRYDNFNLYGIFLPKLGSQLNSGNVAYFFGGYRF